MPTSQPDVNLDPQSLGGREGYFLLTSLVVPRPIAWVSTVSPTGVFNLAPHSFFNVISSDPPIVHWTSTGEKHSLANVRASGEFVINVVSEELLHEMNASSASVGPEVSEFELAGLEPEPSAVVSAPRVARAKAALECRVRDIISMGNGHMVFGDVVNFFVRGSVLRGGRVDPELLRPVGRLSGSGYFVEARYVSVQRPD